MMASHCRIHFTLLDAGFDDMLLRYSRTPQTTFAADSLASPLPIMRYRACTSLTEGQGLGWAVLGSTTDIIMCHVRELSAELVVKTAQSESGSSELHQCYT